MLETSVDPKLQGSERPRRVAGPGLVTALAVTLTALGGYVIVLYNELDQIRSTVATLSTELSTRTTERDGLQASVARLTAEAVSQNDDLADKAKQLAGASEESDRLGKTLQKLHESLTAKEQQVTSLQAQLAETASRLEEQEARKSQAQAQQLIRTALLDSGQAILKCFHPSQRYKSLDLTGEPEFVGETMIGRATIWMKGYMDSYWMDVKILIDLSRDKIRVGA